MYIYREGVVGRRFSDTENQHLSQGKPSSARNLKWYLNQDDIQSFLKHLHRFLQSRHSILRWLGQDNSVPPSMRSLPAILLLVFSFQITTMCYTQKGRMPAKNVNEWYGAIWNMNSCPLSLFVIECISSYKVQVINNKCWRTIPDFFCQISIKMYLSIRYSLKMGDAHYQNKHKKAHLDSNLELCE